MIATESISATLDIVDATVGVASGFPASITVRLRGGGGGSVAAPASGVALSVSSSDAGCVVVTDTLSRRALSAASRSPQRSHHAAMQRDSHDTTENFGSDSVPVRVYPAETFTKASTALSYFNPAPVPNPGGDLVARVASVSYYNRRQCRILAEVSPPAWLP